MNNLSDIDTSETPKLELHSLDGMKNLANYGRAQTSHGRAPTILPEQIRFSLSVPKHKGVHRYQQTTIQFGPAVIAELRWKVGDYIEFLFDDEYFFIRRTHDGRWRITLSSSSNKASPKKVTVSIYPPCPFANVSQSMRIRPVDWVYKDDGVLVAWPKIVTSTTEGE